MVFQEVKDYVSLLGKSLSLSYRTLPPTVIEGDKELRDKYKKEVTPIIQKLDDEIHHRHKNSFKTSYEEMNKLFDKYNKKLKKLDKKYIDLYNEKMKRQNKKLEDTV